MMRGFSRALIAMMTGFLLGWLIFVPAMIAPLVLIPVGIGVALALAKWRVPAGYLAVGAVSLVAGLNYVYVLQELETPGRRTAELVANGAFLVLVAALAAVIVLVARAGFGKTAAAAAILAGLAVVQLATAMMVWIGYPSAPGSPLRWYWDAALPVLKDWNYLDDLLVAHPGVFTFCASVLLTFAVAQRTVPKRELTLT